jgi:organic radical activating enzyme
MKTRLVVWVTSDCNLSCRYCNQKYTIDNNKEYQMSVDEARYIVDSCIRRGIYFEVIELTGGEPSLWINIKEGIELFHRICDDIFLITNGNNPELILSLGLDSWAVSSSQATQDQLRKYDSVRHRITFNAHQHKKPPENTIEDTLPAACVVRTSPQGFPQNQLLYIKGKVYYCCMAYTLSGKVSLTDTTVCSFDEDFLVHYNNKTYNERMCSYCLCNSKVWNKI